jgi:hypothetical protein
VAAGSPDEDSHLGNTVGFIEFVIGACLVYGERFVVQLQLPVSRKSRAARIGGATRWPLVQTSIDRLTLRDFSYVCPTCG